MICSFSNTNSNTSQHDNASEPVGDRSRNTNSVKIDCPFRTHLLRNKKTDHWHVKPKEVEHNHEAVEDLSGLQSYVRQEMTDAVMRHIEQNPSSKPADILAHFRNEMPDTLIRIQDIYNARKRIRHRRLEKYTPTQLLLKAFTSRRLVCQISTTSHQQASQKLVLCQ